MSWRLFLLCCGIFPSLHPALAGIVTGTVTDEQHHPIAFANIYVKGTTTGTTSNMDGNYLISIPPGRYTLIFSSIGYRQQHIPVEVGETDTIRLHVTLQEEILQLPAVEVTAGEDPAYEIMRKVIARKKAHLAGVEGFACRVYVKGLQKIDSAPDEIFGFPVNFSGFLDSNNTGIIYLSESVSDLYRQKPDRLREEMIASRVSGNSNTFSWNKGSDFLISFYENHIDAGPLSDRPLISPLADNAFFFYRYRFEGVMEKDGRLVNKIRVMPRRAHDPVFSGWLYVNEDIWNIDALQLTITKQNQLNFVDSLTITQSYFQVDSTVWMPSMVRFDIAFSLLNIKASGYYLAVFSDYRINPAFPRGFFSREILKIDEDAIKQDENYWQSVRPIPLTAIEQIDYHKKDSLEQLRQSPEYLRQLDKRYNAFNGWDLITGYNYRNSVKKLEWYIEPFYQYLNFNTVEGFNITLPAVVFKSLPRHRSLRIETALRYGFSNKHPNGYLKAAWRYHATKAGVVSAAAGRYVFQFNRDEPISPVVNTLYTLLAEKNYMKLYEQWFWSAGWQSEIFNGLLLKVNGTYARRFPLVNRAEWVFKDYENRQYTPNAPVIPALQQPFERHDAFILEAELHVSIAQRYISRPDFKIRFPSKFPELTLLYKKSIPGVIHSNLNYDHLELVMEDRLEAGLLGRLVLRASAGIFANKNRLTAADIKHFNGNQTLFASHYTDGFQLLDYYAHSTTQPFITAHGSHHFNGFIFNKIPGIRKLRLQFVASVNLLYVRGSQPYTEVGAGIENILRLGRFDVYTAFTQGNPPATGIRIGFDLDRF